MNNNNNMKRPRTNVCAATQCYIYYPVNFYLALIAYQQHDDTTVVL